MIAKCFTVFDVLFFRSLTRSIFVWLCFKKVMAIDSTHLGIVAENMRHYRSLRPALLIVSTMKVTFSLKPRLSI